VESPEGEIETKNLCFIIMDLGYSTRLTGVQSHSPFNSFVRGVVLNTLSYHHGVHRPISTSKLSRALYNLRFSMSVLIMDIKN
jgi:hypothetical protein